MTENSDFQGQMARIQALIRQLERTSDPAVQAAVKELVQCMMEFHCTAVNRMMEVVDQSSPDSAAVIQSLGDDPLVRSLLVLYGLHPQDIATRVAQAVEKLTPVFRKHGAELELESVDDTVVRLRIRGVQNPTVGRTLKDLVEEQIYTLAPDVTLVDGLAALGASELIGIETLVAAGA